MNAIGAAIVVGLGATILLAPRRWAAIGLMLGVLYLTEQQAVDMFGINVTGIRWLEVAGLARVLFREEFPRGPLNPIDQSVLLVYGYSTLVFLVRSDSGHAQMLGWMVDSFSCYFVARAWVKNVEDLKWFLRAFVYLLVPYVALLFVEMTSQANPFSILGAGSWNNELRAGRIRCTGSFRHPSLLGTLGAAMLPLYVGLVFTDSKRTVALAGIALCSAIVLLANSGGPLGAAMMGLAGWLFWAARRQMFAVRVVLVAMGVLLALAMKAPLWYLPARVSALTGGGGWHRSYLMEVAFSELDKWWLAGMDLAETVHWFPYRVEVTGAADITNAYLDLGLKAGLVAVGLFILLLVRAFRRIGQALEVTRRGIAWPRENEYLLWGLGCALTVHIVNWLGITYFDQTYVVWFIQLAAVSALSQARDRRRAISSGFVTLRGAAKRSVAGATSRRRRLLLKDRTRGPWAGR